MTTFLKHRPLIFFLNLSIIHPHNKIIIVLNSSLRYVLGPTPPSDKRNNLPHNSVYPQYVVLYLLRFFLSRDKFAMYLKCSDPHEMFPSNLLQPAQCAEVSAWFNPGWQPQAQRSPERSRMGWGWQCSKNSATIPKSSGFEAATRRYGASNQCHPESVLFEPSRSFSS
jgi:hypothetical protein